MFIVWQCSSVELGYHLKYFILQMSYKYSELIKVLYNKRGALLYN